MNEEKFKLFLDQLIFQINIAIISLNKVKDIYKENKSLMQQKNLRIIEPSEEFWMYLHSYVISLSNIAKIFHPTEFMETDEEFRKRQAERKVFIDQFKEENESLLDAYKDIADKNLRNTLEHIDQHIDRYQQQNGLFLNINRKIAPKELLDMSMTQSVKVNNTVLHRDTILVMGSLEAFFYDSKNDDNDIYSAFGVKLSLQSTFLQLDKLKNKAVKLMNDFNAGKINIHS